MNQVTSASLRYPLSVSNKNSTLKPLKFTQVSSVRLVDFNRLVGWSRSISTVGSVPPTENYGRYRRSVRFIVPRNWSIPTISVGSYKKKSVDGQYRPSKWIYTQKNLKKVLTSSLRAHTSQCQQIKTTVCHTRFCSPSATSRYTVHRDNTVDNATARPQPSSPALASQQCKNNNTVQWLVPVITLVATASNDFIRGCRSNAATAGLTFRCRGRPKPLPLAGLR